MAAFGDIDLNILRGWRQRETPRLRQPHALPALAELIHVESGRAQTIHGPAILLGRYIPRNAPVDLLLGGLKDHQNYRLGAPHLQLHLDEDNTWWCRHLAPGTSTQIAGQRYEMDAPAAALNDHDELRLGVTRYRFKRRDLTLEQWREARQKLLARAERPALFLCRGGAPCGPFFYLDREATFLGKASPGQADFLADAPWEADAQPPAQPEINLAGLYPAERRHVAFLHACVHRRAAAEGSGEGEVFDFIPLATRHNTFINRQEASEEYSLTHGDEIGLGTILFYFHVPGAAEPDALRAPEPPEIFDWSRGGAPSFKEKLSPQEGATDAPEEPDIDEDKSDD